MGGKSLERIFFEDGSLKVKRANLTIDPLTY
jgi:hypothetical protein